MNGITDGITRQNVYEQVLKAARLRLQQIIPSSDGAFTHLSLFAVLNLLFLMRGEWSSIGEYIPTLRALRTVVGDDLLFAEPAKEPAESVPAPLDLVQ